MRTAHTHIHVLACLGFGRVSKGNIMLVKLLDVHTFSLYMISGNLNNMFDKYA